MSSNLAAMQTGENKLQLKTEIGYEKRKIKRMEIEKGTLSVVGWSDVRSFETD